ncbi:MAG: type VI secretion system baseplate subunit TssE [Gemmatimonadota bacterium]
MATPNRSERVVRSSVLDRLVDEEPRVREDPPPNWSDSINHYKRSVLRDLEWLLNSRRTIVEVSPELTEVRSSVFFYGPPDVSSMSGDSPAVRRRLLRHLEELIRTFEPRLSGVRVSLRENRDSASRQIRFVVDGLLHMDPDPERITFDTVLEVSSGTFVVKGEGRDA